MAIREIAFDTETTGLYANKGDRIIEMGCVELINHIPTGRTFHMYINPQRDVPLAATKVHGITTEFLQDKPFFMHVVDPFLDFIQDSTLVIHNASFDMGFVNAELDRLCRPTLSMDRVVDTLQMARRKFPGAPGTLDALCRRFGIDLSERGVHTAILDAQLLAKVYLELLGGRQVSFTFNQEKSDPKTINGAISSLNRDRPKRASRSFTLDPTEEEAHNLFLEGIKNPLWKII